MNKYSILKVLFLLFGLLSLSLSVRAEDLTSINENDFKNGIIRILKSEQSYLGSIDVRALQKLSGFQTISSFRHTTVGNGGKILENLKKQDLNARQLMKSLPVFSESLGDPTQIFSIQTLDKLPFKAPGPRRHVWRRQYILRLEGRIWLGRQPLPRLYSTELPQRDFRIRCVRS